MSYVSVVVMYILMFVVKILSCYCPQLKIAWIEVCLHILHGNSWCLITLEMSKLHASMFTSIFRMHVIFRMFSSDFSNAKMCE